jgi:pimeloyl-ACP methyl ester carboxylesterase
VTTTIAPTEEFLELAGGRVRLLRGGTGEPVLFLHAAGGAGAWLPFHSRLAEAGFEVIAPDHPGFGQSDDFPEVEAIDDLVYHYLDVLEGLGFRLGGARPHVVGASFGGWIAAELAVHSPQLIGSLTLLSADCGHAMHVERPGEFAALVASFLAAHPLAPFAESGVSR